MSELTIHRYVIASMAVINIVFAFVITSLWCEFYGMLERTPEALEANEVWVVRKDRPGRSAVIGENGIYLFSKEQTRMIFLGFLETGQAALIFEKDGIEVQRFAEGLD